MNLIKFIFSFENNQRTSDIRKEGGKIFGAGSRAPIAITFLIKKRGTKRLSNFFHDIGDHTRKLKIIKKLGSIKNLIKLKKLNQIKPDHNNDWINKDDRVLKIHFNWFKK